VQVRVRLFANLREKLAQPRGRGSVELEEGATLADLLARLEIPQAQAQMVLVNGEQAPRDPRRRARLILEEGDTVSVFPPVAGGA
jgi:molybdopterin converting factor small subunit